MMWTRLMVSHLASASAQVSRSELGVMISAGHSAW
jgi:hypothetical protein